MFLEPYIGHLGELVSAISLILAEGRAVATKSSSLFLWSGYEKRWE